MLEQISFRVQEKECFLDSLGVSHVLKLPPHLPDPCYITACELLENSPNLPVGTDGMAMLIFDPCGRYTAKTGGWPGTEKEPCTDPNCAEWLMRLAVLDLQPGKDRFKRQGHDPVVGYSRSRGDLLLLDSRALHEATPAIPIQLVWTLHYLRPGTYTANAGLPEIPSAEGLTGGFGTWSNLPGPEGRSISTTYGPNLSIKFTAPATKALKGLRFRALEVTTPGNVSARLYAADGTTPIGAVGAGEFVNWKNDYLLPLSGSVTQGTDYWVKVTTGNLNAVLEVTAHDAAYSSKRGTSTLPNLDDWRMEIL